MDGREGLKRSGWRRTGGDAKKNKREARERNEKKLEYITVKINGIV